VFDKPTVMFLIKMIDFHINSATSICYRRLCTFCRIRSKQFEAHS